MPKINPNIRVITTNVHELNLPIKRQIYRPDSNKRLNNIWARKDTLKTKRCKQVENK